MYSEAVDDDDWQSRIGTILFAGSSSSDGIGPTDKDNRKVSAEAGFAVDLRALEERFIRVLDNLAVICERFCGVDDWKTIVETVGANVREGEYNPRNGDDNDVIVVWKWAWDLDNEEDGNNPDDDVAAIHVNDDGESVSIEGANLVPDIAVD